MEAAWLHGEIQDRQALRHYLQSSLLQTRRSALPLLVAAHLGRSPFSRLDQLCDAWLTNHVANRASRLMGRAFWTAVTRSFLASTEAPPSPGHLAPVFGDLTSRLALPLDASVSLFLFVQLRGLVSAAVRLGILGPLEAQALQHQLSPFAQSLAVNAESLELHDLATSSPLCDLWQGSHDRLDSRLFQS